MTKSKTAPPGRRAFLDPKELAGDDNAEFRELGGSRVHRFNHSLLTRTIMCCWMPQGGDDGELQGATIVVAAALAGFKPRNEIEGMIAGNAVALHLASMECLRRAMISEQPSEMAAKLRRDGASLARAFTEMVDALDRQRGKGQQTVRVEHVTVNAGGQAIVGAVAATGGSDRKSGERPHAPRQAEEQQSSGRPGSGPALPSPHAEGPAVPAASDAERPMPNARGQVDRSAHHRRN